MRPANCTVCGWPQIVHDGDHAWWCEQVRQWLAGRHDPHIDFDDVHARRAVGEAWHSIARDYGYSTSWTEKLYRQWRRDREAAA